MNSEILIGSLAKQNNVDLTSPHGLMNLFNKLSTQGNSEDKAKDLLQSMKNDLDNEIKRRKKAKAKFKNLEKATLELLCGDSLSSVVREKNRKIIASHDITIGSDSDGNLTLVVKD